MIVAGLAVTAAVTAEVPQLEEAHLTAEEQEEMDLLHQIGEALQAVAEAVAQVAAVPAEEDLDPCLVRK